MKQYSLFFILYFTLISYSNTHFLPGYPNYIHKNTVETQPTKNIYPDVDSTGFIEMKLSGRDYTGDLNKLDTIRNDEYYKKIPKDIMKGSTKLENRYHIELNGKLDEETEIHYSIQKEPEYPGIYNIKIKKNTSELQFGDFNTEYKSGDFVNVQKYINGVETKTIQNKWQGMGTLGKEKSKPQKFESYGNGTKKYKIGKTFLLEGSVKVYINNQKKQENIDYSVNYFEGTVLFKKILTKVDYIKIIYEYTNPIQDFIPSLSRKNFTGVQYIYNPSQNISIEEFKIVSANETLTISEQTQVLSNRIELKHYPISLGSESIFLNKKLLTRGIHYFLKNNTGLIRITNKQLNLNDTITATYGFYSKKTQNDTYIGNNSPGPYKLTATNIIQDTLTVTIDNIKANEFIDYIYNKHNNSIEFYYKVYKNNTISINYDYKITKPRNLNFKDAPFSIALTHLNESTSIRNDLSTTIENEAPESISGVNNNIIILKSNPIETINELVINDQEIAEDDYTLNPYEGTITMKTETNLDINNIKVNYKYLKSFPSEHSIKGLGIQSYRQDEIKFYSLPIKYKGITKITIFDPDEKILEEGRDYEITYESFNNEFKDLVVKFIIGGYSILNNYPRNSDIIKLSYLYTPKTNKTAAKSKHNLTNLRLKNNITDQWKVYTEIANTKYNYSKRSNYQKDTFTEQQPDNKYQLKQGANGVEDGSEQVFINGFSQTRDTDYYINYETGEITFINKTIPDNQIVEVSYSYYSSTTPHKNDVNAYAIESIYLPKDSVQITNKVNIIDPNFLPIGTYTFNTGSSKYFNKINWDINKEEQINFIFEKEEIVNKDYSTLLTKNTYLSNFKLNIAQLKTTHAIRYDHVSATKNTSENSKKIIKYDNTFKHYISDNELKLSNTISQKNELISDQSLHSIIGGSRLDYLHYYSLPSFVKKGSATPYYGYNIDFSNISSNTLSYKKQTIENMGINTTTKFHDTLINTSEFDKSIYKTELPSKNTISDKYYNYSSNTTFNPSPWLSTNLSLNHEESISPIPGQENTVEDRTGYNILKINPDATLKYINAPRFIIKPFKGSYSSLGHTKTKKRENNALKNYKETQIFGTFNAWKPLKGFTLPKFDFFTNESNLLNETETSHQKWNNSTTKSYKYITSFTYKPPLKHLNRLSFDGSITQSNSNQTSITEEKTSTINTIESTFFNNTQKYGMNINIPNIPLLITSIKSPSLRIEENQKIKKDTSNTSSTDTSKNQKNIDLEDIFSNVYFLKYNILIFNINNSAINEDSYFNQNKITEQTSSLFRNKKVIDQKTTYSLFNTFNNTNYGKFERISQYKKNEIDIEPSQLITNNDTSLRLDEIILNHETKLALSNWMTLTGKIEYQNFKQTQTSGNTFKIEQNLNQNSLDSGIIVTPLSGLTLSYNFLLKQLINTQKTKTSGYKDTINIKYIPIKYKNFELQFNFNREKNWGSGFNKIEKDILFQTTNEVLALDIIPRNDMVYLSSLNLNIVLPINNSEHLERIIFSGEGYFKKIIDQLTPKNAYMVNGFLFNVRMEL
jgi:hypothetical protein